MKGETNILLSARHQEFGDAKGIKTVVMTYSSIHVNVASVVSPVCAEQNVQVNFYFMYSIFFSPFIVLFYLFH